MKKAMVLILMITGCSAPRNPDVEKLRPTYSLRIVATFNQCAVYRFDDYSRHDIGFFSVCSSGTPAWK
jgi:hypothetical protein